MFRCVRVDKSLRDFVRFYASDASQSRLTAGDSVVEGVGLAVDRLTLVSTRWL